MSNEAGTLTAFERDILSKLLAGNHPILAALRDQLRLCRVRSRETTGHGFFTNLEVDRSAAEAALPGGRVRIGDVGAEIDGLRHGAGFVLSVLDGFLECIEGFSYEEPWPSRIRGYALRFERDRAQDPSSVGLPKT